MAWVEFKFDFDTVVGFIFRVPIEQNNVVGPSWSRKDSDQQCALAVPTSSNPFVGRHRFFYVRPRTSNSASCCLWGSVVWLYVYAMVLLLCISVSFF